MTDRIAFAGKVTTEGRRLRGSVQVAGSRTFRNNEWLEVDPAALVKADASDVLARFDHDPAKVLARIKNDTLTLSRTDQGIEWETAELPNTSYANDALELANGGYVAGSSFEIEGIKSKVTTEPGGTRVRRITSIQRLVDVAPVFDPAFTSTAAAFKKETGMSETTEQPVEEPQAPPAPPAAPEPKEEPKRRAQFSSDGSLYEATVAFARKLTTAELGSAIDGVWAEAGDNPDEMQLQKIEAFTEVFEERREAESSAEEQRKRLKFLNDMRRGVVPKAPEAGLLESDDYKEAFSRYLRSGRSQDMEQFAQSIAGTGAEGGYTVPDGFLQRITESQKAFGGIAGVADTITTADGQSLRWPSNDDTGNTAAIAAEGAAGAAGADLVFGSITLGAFSYNSNGVGNVPLKVSFELLQDSAFDIAAFIGRKLGERIGRKQAADLANGGGTTLPFGLLSKTPDTVTATKTLEAAIEMEFHIDAAYRNAGNCRWVMSDATLFKYRSAVDLNNRPLWLPSAEAGMTQRAGGILNGYPVTLDNAAADKVAFGDIRQGYIVRYVRSVELLVNPYSSSATRQVEYHAWARMDANIQDAAAYSVGDFAGVSADEKAA